MTLFTNNSTKTGDCEACTKTQVAITVHYGNLWLCDDCWQKEQALQTTNMEPAKQEARVNEVIERAQKIDTSIQVKTDLFNAETVSIAEIQAAIENDATIPADKKRFAVCKIVAERRNNFQKLIFDKRQEILDLESNARADQTYLNTQANMLRKEERDAIKAQDIDYKPITPKTPKPPSEKKPSSSKRINQAELDAAIKKYNEGGKLPNLQFERVVRNVLAGEPNLTIEQACMKVAGIVNK